MRSAMAAVSRAGRTSWTRRMWAPARMAAVLAMVVGSVVGEADPSAALRDDNKGALRDDNKGALRDDNKGALRDDNKGALRDDDWAGFFASHPSPDAAKDGAPELLGPAGGLVMRSHLLTTMMTERPDSWA